MREPYHLVKDPLCFWKVGCDDSLGVWGRCFNGLTVNTSSDLLGKCLGRFCSRPVFLLCCASQKYPWHCKNFAQILISCFAKHKIYKQQIFRSPPTVDALAKNWNYLIWISSNRILLKCAIVHLCLVIVSYDLLTKTNFISTLYCIREF